VQGGDWGTKDFINGGLDMSMPGQGFGDTFGTSFGDVLLSNVKNSSVTEARVDDAVSSQLDSVLGYVLTSGSKVIRTLTPWIAHGQADTPLPNVTFNADPTFFTTDDAKWRDVRQESTMDLIRKIGKDSATLLKNIKGALPLRKPKVIAVIGSDAGPNTLSAINGGGSNSYPAWNMVCPTSHTHLQPLIVVVEWNSDFGRWFRLGYPAILGDPLRVHQLPRSQDELSSILSIQRHCL
jgi:beta-glucosidase